VQLSLTGLGFLFVVILVTVAALVSTVVLFPRMSLSRPWTIVRRALMMLGVNALVVLTAAVALNDQYAFFADWTDLHGAVLVLRGDRLRLPAVTRRKPQMRRCRRRPVEPPRRCCRRCRRERRVMTVSCATPSPVR